MTDAEMIEEFDRLRDVFQSPGYDPADKYAFLNRSVSALVNSYFPEEQRLPIDIQINQRRTDDLHTLFKTDVCTVTTVGAATYHPRATAIIEFPPNYRFFQGIAIRFGSVYAKKVTQITYDEIEGLYRSDLTQPDNESNVYLVQHNGMFLIFCSTVPTSVSMIHLKNPIKIDVGVSCDLPEHMHWTVVTLAYQISLLPSDQLSKFQVSNLLNKINKTDANA